MPSLRPRAAVLLLIVSTLLTGCVRYRVYELDTAGLEDFDWNGTVLVTEETRPELDLFGVSQRKHFTRVDLVGENDRNVVIFLDKKYCDGSPLAKLQDVGRPPDQILALLVLGDPMLRRVAAAAANPADATAEDKEAVRALANRYIRAISDSQNGGFDELNAADIVFLCAADPARHVESLYHGDSGTRIRAHVTDRNLLTVVVEDASGRVLHRYEPQKLKVTVVGD